MKFDDLCSVAHNLADSLGSGASYLFNIWDDHVYSAASRESEKFIELDLLNGQILRGRGSEILKRVVALSPGVLGELCGKHGADVSVFRRLSVRYSVSAYGRQFEVTVEDQHGRCRTDGYTGTTGSRLTLGKHPPVSTDNFD